MKNFIISTVLVLLLTQKIITDSLPYAYQYLMWDLTNLISLVCISFLLLIQIPYIKYYRKFSSFLIFDISLYALFYFFMRLLSVDEGIYYSTYFLVISSIILSVIFLRSYIKFFIKSSDIYVRNNSYLVYKYPKSIWGVLSTIHTAPYGHCFLVIDKLRYHYDYKKGVIVETTFDIKRNKGNLIFRRINPVDVNDARKLVGKKWNILNNCFSTFNKFK